MRKIHAIALLGLCLGPASAALASDQPGTTYDQWKEETSGPGPFNGSPDAGQFPSGANLTRGQGGLNKINGQFVLTRDADMYCIFVSNPSGFSAVITGGGDSNMALFTLAGNGIAFNDNNPAGGTGSALSNTFTSSLPSGLYMLAVSRNDVGFGPGTFNRPLNGSLVQMFNDSVRNVEVGPNNAGDVLTDWENNSTSGFQLFNANYTITLTGADYHLVPTPGAGLMLAVGGLVAARRRR